jgi:hypothetical protein
MNEALSLGRRTHVKAFNGFDLPETADKTRFGRLEPGLQVCFRYVECERGTDDARSQNQYIHIVVFHALVSGISIVAYRCANPGHFIGRDTNADSRAADQDAPLRQRCHKRPTDRCSEIRIVRWLSVVGAEVRDIVTKPSNVPDYFLLESETRMVRSDCDLHSDTLS